MMTKEINYLEAAKRVFEIESLAVKDLSEKLDKNFSIAVDAILESAGKVIVCGMGKSGIIGKKIAATLASTGTPSFFMHPGEAYHGDLGMVAKQDVFVAISYSGETEEVVKLLPFLNDNGNFLISITGNSKSTLAKAAKANLDVGVAQEACPLQLAPTSSTTCTLAMGDALAVTLMDARQFKSENFARFHPGGSLGRRLLSKVEHEMVTKDLPVVDPDAGVMDVIRSMSTSMLGLALVKTESDWSIITDGDVRRAIERHDSNIFSCVASDLMTPNAASIKVGIKVEDAFQKMEQLKISSLLVFDETQLVGILKR